MVRKLYGVAHGGCVQMGGVSLSELFGQQEVGEIHMRPSVELISELAVLPVGAKIGLEEMQEQVVGNKVRDFVVVDGKHYELAMAGVSYWQALLDECLKRRLEPVFLDSFELLAQNTRLRLDSAKLNSKANGVLKRYAKRKGLTVENCRFPERTMGRALEFVRSAYALETEAEYMHIVGREGEILRKIAQTNPDVVIMGASHTDFFAARPEEVAKFGVKFESYAREDFEEGLNVEVMLRYGERLHHVPIRLIQNAQPQEELLVERDQTIRKHNAARFGRIFPERKPRFVGTWNRNIPAAGLFEVYMKSETETPEGRVIFGKIEDIIGTASFIGSLREEHIRFRKEYTDTSKRAGGSRYPIDYDADFREGRYVGVANLGNDGSLEFEMVELS